MANERDVDAVIVRYLQTGRLRPHEEGCSVLVRLLDGSREGQQLQPASGPVAGRMFRMPRYMEALDARHLDLMRREMRRGNTYSQARPTNQTDEAWVELLNSTILRVVGIELTHSDDTDDDGEGTTPAVNLGRG
ncbi:hypothetical protein V8C86DRAFT_797371 [Haematococcus lacustris]